MQTTINQVHSTAPVLTYARLLRENHILIAAGKGDSSEAEILADQMDGPLVCDDDSRNRRRMSGLSEDQYTLHEGGPKRGSMSAIEEAAWQQSMQEALSQMERGDIDATLHFLRQPSPESFPVHRIRCIQAQCWQKLGDLETAVVFMKEADRLNPEDASSVLALEQLRLSSHQGSCGNICP